MTTDITPLILAGIALGSSIITAEVNSWLGGRAHTSEELRESRLKAYPSAWLLTAGFSRWPRTTATYADIEGSHRQLRAWYFQDGGLFMSENSRARYGD